MVRQRIWLLWLAVISLLFGSCTVMVEQNDLNNTMEVLETQVSQQGEWLSNQATQIIAQQEWISYQSTQISQQEGWLSYQSTQIGAHQGMIMYLATGAPAGQAGRYGFPQNGTLTPIPYQPVGGSVMIHNGGCCVGGKAGSIIEVDVQFSAYSQLGEVVEMRVLVGPPLTSEAEMDDLPWEPFSSVKIIPISVATNWTSVWVHVQYRDESGMLSPVFSDDIDVEGN